MIIPCLKCSRNVHWTLIWHCRFLKMPKKYEQLSPRTDTGQIFEVHQASIAGRECTSQIVVCKAFSYNVEIAFHIDPETCCNLAGCDQILVTKYEIAPACWVWRNLSSSSAHAFLIIFSLTSYLSNLYSLDHYWQYWTPSFPPFQAYKLSSKAIILAFSGMLQQKRLCPTNSIFYIFYIPKINHKPNE